MEKLRIGVVGIGLIGGSLLKSLDSQDFSLSAVSASQATVDKVLEQNLAHNASIDFSILKNSDVVFIATPMNKILETIDKVADIVSENCIITDAGSLKSFVMEYVDKGGRPIRFVGGHPMAGTEKKGIDAAQQALFKNAKWVLTPSKWSRPEDIKKLEHIIQYVEAIPLIAEAEEHDKAVALISHMPMVLSEALYSAVSNYKEESIKELALKLAASGFRDMTRLAMTNPEMAKDMIENNRLNIEDSLALVSKEGKKLMDLDYFSSEISNIIEQRSNMYSDQGNNIL